jgi:hypothetical protein
MGTHRTLPLGRDDHQIAQAARGSDRRWRRNRRLRWLAVFACGLCWIAWSAPPAAALIVTTTTLDTTQPPADDPGWNSVTGGLSLNYTYLGNGWALTAFHVARLIPLSDQLMNFGPAYAPNFGIIPNQGYSVPNPSGSGMTLSPLTDLFLVRLNGDPGLPSLPIASQALTNADIGASVTFAGLGPTRDANTSTWDGHLGYYGSGYTKRWGKNQIANETPYFTETADNDLHGKVSLNIAGDVRDVISMITIFDQGTDQTYPYEAQAIGGDSGSAVFHKNGSQWELIGIVNSALIYQNQPSNFAAYTGGTTFADLTFYRNEILNIMNGHTNYSVSGDVNLDGQVTGDGTGSWATDDVTAFVQGWNWQQAQANVVSWKKGDLNLDGVTNVNDFFLMRSALNNAGLGAGASSLSGLFGTGTVPEPSSLILAAGAIGFALSRRRPRTRRTLS